MLINKPNPHGGDIYRNAVRYDFSANVSPLGTPEAVKSAVREAADHVCAYPDPHCAALREVLSQHESVPAEHILCGNGAAELIYAFAAALRPERSLIAAPAFCEYAESLAAFGSTADYYILHEEDAFLTDGRILNVIGSSHYDAVYLCNPSNPAGKLTDKKLLHAIAKLCRGKKSMLFIDECFLDLTVANESHSMTEMVEDNPYLFILKAFTKSYGMAGLRLGYALCSDETLLRKMTEVTQVWNVSAVAQTAGIAALGCGAYLRRVREVVAEERAYLTEALRALGYRVFDGAANFLLFKAEESLYGRLLEKGILIRQCGNFVGLDDRFYRCAVKTHEENLALIKAMEEIAHG